MLLSLQNAVLPSRIIPLKAGFSLLELSVVIVILSFLLIAILPQASLMQDRQRNEQLLEQLHTIEAALINYRKKNVRLPCPANGALAQTAADYGIEGAPVGGCTSGSPAANFGPDSYTVGGVLPTKTLGLPDMLDPWGRRFSYHVDQRATQTSAFARYRIGNPYIGEITVFNSGGGERTDRAVVVVISHGKNGHGAYMPSGVRRNANITNTEELTNCHCNSAGVSSSYDNEFVLQPQGGTGRSDTLDDFDDIGFYLERMHLVSQAEIR